MTFRVMRWAAVVVTLAAVVTATGCASTPTCSSGVRDGVFVHIKSGPEHAHSVLMGLRMAQLMSQDRDALVYFDVDGIKAVVKDAPEMRMEPFGSAREMLDDLIARRVPVYACPGCLKALGKTPDQLMPGIKVAEKEGFFNFTRGRILTIDY
ncbi:MAG: DsrE family protein [Phycisphaerae bacterium]|nr:DsrE family protein [Phycisphaerae bacterium]